MSDPASFLRKIRGVVGGGLRAQVETLESSRHCGSLVEAGVNRKTPAQGTQGSRRHSQRQRCGRLGRASWGRVPEAAAAGKGHSLQGQQEAERGVRDFCF